MQTPPRAKALKVGADKLGEPFIKVEKQYEELTRAIENDNLSYAQKNADKVQSAFRKIEISAIKNNALGDAREMMAAAEKAKLQKIAPAAYNDAIQSLNTADAYIDQNPYAAETMDRKAAQAEFMARRLMAISESSKKIQGLEPEAAALYVESLMMRLSRALNSGDLRDKTVEGQVATLTGAAEAIEQNKRSLEARNQTYHKKITDLEQRLAALRVSPANRSSPGGNLRRNGRQPVKNSQPNGSSMSVSTRFSAIFTPMKPKYIDRGIG